MEHTDKEIAIEERRMGGVSLKLFIGIIIFICGGVFSYTVVYVNLSRDMKDVQTKQTEFKAETNAKLDLQDKKIEIIITNQQRTEIWQGRMEGKIDK